MATRSAGVLIPLFSLRTRESLGRGEILDLAPMIDFAVAMGCTVIQLLPLDETSPIEQSPYSALSVHAIDPMYISMRDLGGVGRVVLGRARAAVGVARIVGRSIVRREKLALLERSYRLTLARGVNDSGEKGEEGAEFSAFLAANSYWLDDYALFRALQERFDPSWEAWPAELAHREPEALAAARRESADAIEMYCYWQFIAHRQWAAMRSHAALRGMRIGGDLAFSPCRDSAEVWAHQTDFDLTRSVGAPPDDFNPQGQRWGLPMPNWERMRSGGLKLMRARVRHASSLYDLIRIDHVVGLYRTFNFGDDPDAPGIFTPADEEQQRIQGEEIIRVVREEAGATEIIAEDLGTVPPWVRDSLTKLRVPGYKVMQWERNWGQPDEAFRSPASYPELSVATTGTHDTESLTTWWREQPIPEREKLVHALGIEKRVNPRAMLDEAGRDAILTALYAAPSRLVIMPIQDLFGWTARINRPGTVLESNWTYRLPLTLERLRRSRGIKSRVAKLREIAIRTNRLSP